MEIYIRVREYVYLNRTSIPDGNINFMKYSKFPLFKSLCQPQYLITTVIYVRAFAGFVTQTRSCPVDKEAHINKLL